MAYKPEEDYSALIDDAVAAGDYRAAAGYEQSRNEKISGEGLDYEPTSRFSGWLDDTDYGSVITDQIASGAPVEDVAGTLSKRVAKSAGTEGLSQYARDDIYNSAIEYIMGGGSGEFSYETAPQWSSKYSGQIDDMVNGLLNREAFSYDPNSDPLYNQYRDTYTREGARAMQDTVGEVSARTGGLASSYAATAGNQANNYYMSQLADKVPELRQLAYQMYQDDYNTQLSNLQVLTGLDDADFGRYQVGLGQFNTDRDFAYGKYSDDWNRDYTEEQQRVSNALTSWQTLGYANAETAAVLGVPEGTSTADQAYQDWYTAYQEGGSGVYTGERPGYYGEDGATYSGTLYYGAQGGQVYSLQALLQGLGYLSSTPDGVFGPQTQAALIAFQEANGITGTGMTDKDTWAQLQSPDAVKGSAGSGASDMVYTGGTPSYSTRPYTGGPPAAEDYTDEKGIAEDAYDYITSHPEIALDSRTLDGYLSQNGYSGEDAQLWRAYAEEYGGVYSRR